MSTEAARLDWDADGDADRDWGSVTNWSPDVEPTAADDAYIDGGCTAVVSSAGEVATNVYVGHTGTGALFLASGSLTIGANMELGVTGTGTGRLEMTGGSLDAKGSLFIANDGTASAGISAGSMTVTNTARDFVIGKDGIGSLMLSGGAVTTRTAYVADTASADGSTLNVTGGRFVTLSGANLSMDASGQVNVSGTGEIRVGGDWIVGRVDGAAAVANVGGGEMWVKDFLRLGYAASSVGTLNLSGGRITVSNDMAIGSFSGGTGIVVQTGGTLAVTNNNPLSIGQGGGGRHGSYTITNGVLSIAGGAAADLRIGDSTCSGFFHVVGGQATIGVEDSLVMDSEGTAELRATVVSDGLSPIMVGKNIELAQTLSVSNIAAVSAGEYVVVTSSTASAVSGTFDATNWLGAAEGAVIYGDTYVSLIFTPELAVLGTNDAVVADGDTTPAATDGTLLNIDLPNSTTNTLTVINQDAVYELTLTGSQYVALSGPQADDFAITQPADSNIVASGERTFRIAFTPSYIGTHTAEVTIASDDLRPDKDPYTFAIHGTGRYTYEPTAAASNLVFSAVSNDQMTVSWAAGDGDNRMLIARAAAALATDPADGTTYAANAGYSNGTPFSAEAFVVYNGSGSSVIVTNLRPGVEYHFELFEHSGVDGGINYLTAPTLTGMQAAATYPPVITNGASVSRTISENGDPTAFALDVRATDIDAKYGDVGAWALGEAPAHGTAVIGGTGFDADQSVTYTPHPYYAGTDRFEVKVTDSFGNVDRIEVHVMIEAVNTPGKPLFIFE